MEVLEKLEGYSGLYERGALGDRMEMVAGLLMVGADSVAVVLEVLRTSALISGARYYQEYG